jgi:oxygen-independent coproporphyrinogen-3 oxidase
VAAAEASSAPGLYVHVPFCSQICNYCNFNRGLFDEALKAQFVGALLREIATRAAPHARSPDTLYFGGGTPSLLAPAEIRSIVDESRRSFGLTVDAEITLEANPESVDLARLAGFRDAGVNRLSFGVQSFRDAELARLGRLHSSEKARDALRLARTAGFDNISLDLMMWLPGQDLEQWLTSVDAAVRVAPDHFRSTCSRSTRTSSSAARWTVQDPRRPTTTWRPKCTSRPWNTGGGRLPSV